MTPVAQKEYDRLIKSFQIDKDAGRSGCDLQMFVAQCEGKGSECREILTQLEKDGYWTETYGGFPYEEDEFTSIHWPMETDDVR